MSIQEKDSEPRYEISKIQALAEIDLDQTRLENLSSEEKIYGNGIVLGHDIDTRIREELDAQDSKL